METQYKLVNNAKAIESLEVVDCQYKFTTGIGKPMSEQDFQFLQHIMWVMDTTKPQVAYLTWQKGYTCDQWKKKDRYKCRCQVQKKEDQEEKTQEKDIKIIKKKKKEREVVVAKKEVPKPKYQVIKIQYGAGQCLSLKKPVGLKVSSPVFVPFRERMVPLVNKSNYVPVKQRIQNYIHALYFVGDAGREFMTFDYSKQEHLGSEIIRHRCYYQRIVAQLPREAYYYIPGDGLGILSYYMMERKLIYYSTEPGLCAKEARNIKLIHSDRSYDTLITPRLVYDENKANNPNWCGDVFSSEWPLLILAFNVHRYFEMSEYHKKRAIYYDDTRQLSKNDDYWMHPFTAGRIYYHRTSTIDFRFQRLFEYSGEERSLVVRHLSGFKEYKSEDPIHNDIIQDLGMYSIDGEYVGPPDKNLLTGQDYFVINGNVLRGYHNLKNTFNFRGVEVNMMSKRFKKNSRVYIRTSASAIESFQVDVVRRRQQYTVDYDDSGPYIQTVLPKKGLITALVGGKRRMFETLSSKYDIATSMYHTRLKEAKDVSGRDHVPGHLIGPRVLV